MAIKKFTPQNSDLFIGKDQGDHTLGKFGHLNYILREINALDTTVATGLPVEFSTEKIYGSATSPLSSNITASLTGAVLGKVQKIYHQDGVAPTFPSGWVQLGTTTYSTTGLNIIYAEWASGTRVEYWIIQ